MGKRKEKEPPPRPEYEPWRPASPYWKSGVASFCRTVAHRLWYAECLLAELAAMGGNATVNEAETAFKTTLPRVLEEVHAARLAVEDDGRYPNKQPRPVPPRPSEVGYEWRYVDTSAR